MSKRIVICADGTGNRGGVTRGTNVYRISNAIDIWGHVGTHRKKQVMYYQDGVGTDKAKILKAVGGAFGYGLSANVRQLYNFLVRNHNDGDEIFLFGFSRGAYTVRTLAHLVTACGLIDRSQYNSRSELERLIGKAYKAHRKTQKKEIPEWNEKALARRRREEETEGRRETPADVFKRKYGRIFEDSKTRCDRDFGPKDVAIKLIGVWDTVGAVGLPFDELTDALDVHVGLKFKNSTLSPQVEIGLQALAIDEERHTFHPVLWNESEKKSWQTIEQVWFSGMHSNVGGGYPKDQLAHVALKWMMERAEDTSGLRFIKQKREDLEDAANPNGRMYNSRSGLSIYYRYRPRNIRKLSEGKLAEGEKPKIHASVLERIRRGTAGYSPTAMGDFEVVDEQAAESRAFESKRAGERGQFLELARDLIWWRRLLYYTFLGVTIGLVLRLVWLGRQPVNCEVDWPFLGWLFDVGKWLTPAIAAGPIDALRNHPYYFFLYLVIGIFLWVCHRIVTGATSTLALAGWKSSLGEEEWERPGKNLWHKIGHWFRRSTGIESALHLLKRRLLPHLLAWGLPLLVVLGLTQYALNAWGTVGGTPPTEACCADLEPLLHGDSVVIEDFDITEPCFQTNVQLVEGQDYGFEVEAQTQWKDASVAGSPEGVPKDAWSRPMRLFKSFRRSKQHDYLALMGGISCDQGQTFKIGDELEEVTADATGRLYLFANDATCYVCPGSAWRLYKNNQGKARITVRHLGAAAD